MRLLQSWAVNTRSPSEAARYNSAFAAEMTRSETTIQHLEDELVQLLGLQPGGTKVKTGDACQLMCTYVVCILNRLFCAGLVDVSIVFFWFTKIL